MCIRDSNVANIAPALRDRMEMINIPGYLVEEKIRIALDHLLPKQREAHGIKEQELVMTPQIVEGIISGYTRESGVRSLDKLLAKIARARAKQIAFDEAFAPEITAKDVEKILGMPKFLREEYEVEMCIRDSFERRADGRQLHAVVGRQAESLRKLLAVTARKQHRAVTARSGISQGRAVGVYGDLCHAGLFQRRQLLPDGRDFRFCDVYKRQGPWCG